MRQGQLRREILREPWQKHEWVNWLTLGGYSAKSRGRCAFRARSHWDNIVASVLETLIAYQPILGEQSNTVQGTVLQRPTSVPSLQPHPTNLTTSLLDASTSGRAPGLFLTDTRGPRRLISSHTRYHTADSVLRVQSTSYTDQSGVPDCDLEPGNFGSPPWATTRVPT